MKFDIYGRFQLDILREGRAWVAYRMADGKRVRDDTIVITSSEARAAAFAHCPSHVGAYADCALLVLAQGSPRML